MTKYRITLAPLWLLTLLFYTAISKVNAQYTIYGPESTYVNDINTYTVSGAQNFANINWSVSGGVSYTVLDGQGTDSAVIKFTSAGNATVDFYGISNGAPVSVGKNVTVNDSGVGQVSITSGPTIRCKGGGTSDYNANATNATSYVWSLTNAGSSTINSSTGVVTWSSSFAGVARVSVTASDAFNNSTSASRNVTVDAITENTINASATEICGSGTVSLTIGPLDPNTRYELKRNGIVASGPTDTNPGETTAQATWSVGEGTYSVVAQRRSGPACITEWGSVTITRLQDVGNPQVSGSQQLCSGIVSTDYNVSGGNGGNAYSWSLVNGGAATINSTSGEVTWNGFTGTATVRLTATPECGSAATINYPVTVDKITENTINASATEICGSGTVSLTIGPLDPNTRYELKRNGIVASGPTDTNPGETTAQATWTVGEGTYSVVAQRRSGPACITEWGSVTITRLQDVGNPQVIGSQQLCSGTISTPYEVTGGSIGNAYIWSLDNGGVATINSSSGVVTWNGFTGTATVRLTATPECGNQTTIDHSVTVDKLSNPSLSANATEICGSGTVTLTTGVLEPNTRYELIRNGIVASDPVDTQPNETTSVASWDVGAGTYGVRAERRSDPKCTTEWNSLVTISMLQDVGNPQIMGTQNLCSGTISTPYEVTGGSIGNEYIWSLDNGGVATINSSSGVVTWNGFTGTATVRLTATPECGSVATINYPVTVTSIEQPTLVANGSEICGNGDSVSLDLFPTIANARYELRRGGALVEEKFVDTNGTPASLTWALSNIGVYTVEVHLLTSPNCSATFAPVEITQKVTDVVITTTPTDLTNICAGTPITLTSNGTSNLWSTGETTTSIEVFPVAGSITRYELTAKDPDCGVQKTTYIDITPQVPTLWYVDTDGDGFGDPYAPPEYDCNNRGAGWADNNDDLCPDDFGIAGNHGCPAGFLFENRNWITTKSYDLNTTLKSSSKSYYNDLGKLEQMQTLDINSNRTWASQVLYDSHGRVAIQSLSAPNGLSGAFQFQPNFMRNHLGDTYALSDFDDTTKDPSIVGKNDGTLGWYYSDQNNDQFYEGNNYLDITDHPFSRTIYSTLSPGSILKVIGGNKVDTNGDGTIGVNEWPQAYTFTMPVGQELSQSMAFGSTAYDMMKISKTISRDVRGTENVIFTDTDGKVLASARSGNEANPNQQKYSISISIGEQAYVDVHLPTGCSGITLSGGPTSGSNTIDVYDLIADAKISQSLSSLPSGLYRIAVGTGFYDGTEPYIVTHEVNYYDYSLNEYDKANRLVKSYQPLGATKATKPFTLYDYNALGQLVHTDSPDEGEAWFKYREDGQIRFSQNSKQKIAGEFSYTHYDTFGRPMESGVFVENTTYVFDPTNATGLDAIIDNVYTIDQIQNDTDDFPDVNCKEQQFTTYDVADDAALAAALGSPRANLYTSQSFVAGNVAHTANDIGETWYAYDVYGRVKWLVQHIQGLGVKTIDYEYHPITGLVTQVIFQKDVSAEEFIHRYGYDVQDRLSTVETSSNGGATFDLQAQYSYYETGGLRRVDLANGAQGVDYIYNLAGQLKSINHPSLAQGQDPGSDSNDLFGMQLDYHVGDYQRNNANIVQSTYGTDQFNGNIKGVRWSNAHDTGTSEYVYSYDRNNWLTAADFNPSNQTGGLDPTLSLSGNVTGDHAATNNIVIAAPSTISAPSTLRIDPSGTGFSPGDYDVANITYDANGNIKTLKRNKGSQDGNNTMDDLSYTYKTTPQDGPNQLVQVVDDAYGGTGDAPQTNDIATQTDADNYRYNDIGQLIENKAEKIKYFYTTSGLVTEVQQELEGVYQPAVRFYYNDRNHRVKKESYANGNLASTTYYVRDVAGQIMAIYTDNNQTNTMALAEQPIYGSGRIGVAYNGGNTVYEMTDHLGNVRAVFTKNQSNEADLEGYTDYYPFGMPMPRRSLIGPDGYRYAFQGQEKDPETGKEAFELRLWDSRIGRWLTTDPAGQYASPYLGMGNNWINVIDPDGGQDCRCGFFRRLTRSIGNFFKDNFGRYRPLKPGTRRFNREMRTRPEGIHRIRFDNLAMVQHLNLLSIGPKVDSQELLANYSISRLRRFNSPLSFVSSLGFTGYRLSLSTVPITMRFSSGVIDSNGDLPVLANFLNDHPGTTVRINFPQPPARGTKLSGIRVNDRILNFIRTEHATRHRNLVRSLRRLGVSPQRVFWGYHNRPLRGVSGSSVNNIITVIPRPISN